MEYLIDYWNKVQEEKKSKKVIEEIHKEIIQQLEKPHMDSDEGNELEAGQNFGIYNFLK